MNRAEVPGQQIGQKIRQESGGPDETKCLEVHLIVEDKATAV
jgi:hypothetical protein